MFYIQSCSTLRKLKLSADDEKWPLLTHTQWGGSFNRSAPFPYLTGVECIIYRETKNEMAWKEKTCFSPKDHDDDDVVVSACFCCWPRSITSPSSPGLFFFFFFFFPSVCQITFNSPQEGRKSWAQRDDDDFFSPHRASEQSTAVGCCCG